MHKPLDKTLAMHSLGEGETIVMLHGWGMHSGMFNDIANHLSQRFRVVRIDLPGHGNSSSQCSLALEDVSQQILSQIESPCHWLGWSLGGSIVMNLALMAPVHFKSMTLLSASPCFVSQSDWAHGIHADVFASFADDLQQDYQKTLKKFIALQTLSSADRAITLKQLRQQLFSMGEPDQLALQQGLDILIKTDLRNPLQNCQVPGMIVLGERDQLVPVSVADYYQSLTNPLQVNIIDKAGHAPFLSHHRQVAGLIENFIQQHTHDVIDNG